MEPVTSIVVSIALFGNPLNSAQWLGGVLILAATAITIFYGNIESQPLS